jgi:polar amino acid transport system substrate-binding protein
MKTLILTATALAIGAGAAFAESHGMTVRMGTEGAYPPYNFINDAGEVDGFERELGDEMCTRAELTCEWVTNDWDSIIPNLVSGNYDTIIAGMSITDERDEVIDFTQAYLPPDPSAYVGLAGSELDTAAGVIAAQTGTIQAAHIAAMGATLVEFATPEETIAAVRNGEADAVLADRAFLIPIIEDSGGELAFVAKNVMIGGGVGMGVRESDGELRETFDGVITAMKEDGTLDQMIIKWFGDEALTWAMADEGGK